MSGSIPSEPDEPVATDLRHLSKDKLRELVELQRLRLQDLTDVIEGNQEIIEHLKQLLGCYQEGRLDSRFNPGQQVHEFRFTMTEFMLKADPDVLALARTLATRIKQQINFIKTAPSIILPGAP